jgi:hypothetical protein
MALSQGHSQAISVAEAGRIHQPSQFQRSAFTSRLSFKGRHSPAVSASEVGIHQPSQFGIAAFSVSKAAVLPFIAHLSDLCGVAAMECTVQMLCSSD